MGLQFIHSVQRMEWGNKPGEVEHLYIFIYQNIHKPDDIHQYKTQPEHTHQALEKAIKYLKGGNDHS